MTITTSNISLSASHPGGSVFHRNSFFHVRADGVTLAGLRLHGGGTDTPLVRTLLVWRVVVHFGLPLVKVGVIWLSQSTDKQTNKINI